MKYQILARKWRPQSFEEVTGQKNIVKAISNELSGINIHHAWLLSGTRGIGKTTIARLLAKSLNCETGITPHPCRKCVICKEIEKSLCLDVFEIDAASRTKVEDMREILDNVHYFPSKSRFKIYLIDEVHMLSRHSFNALLKTLEEPPQHVKFILATTNAEKIPKTVISRCLYFRLKMLTEEKILNLMIFILKKESIQFDIHALKEISYYAKGSMRDALNLLEHAIHLGKNCVNIKDVISIFGIPPKKYILLLIQEILKKNFNQVMFLLHEIEKFEVEWEEILIEILRILHQLYTSKLFPIECKKNINKSDQIEIKKIMNNFDVNNLQLCYQILIEGRKNLNLAPNNKIGVEMILFHAIHQLSKINIIFKKN